MNPSPLALIAELTHRCPLRCVYCSNPLQLVHSRAELSTEEWGRVFEQAASLGVMHLHLTGGEPAARRDLRELIAAGRHAGLYVNLITSGVGLQVERISDLVDAGVDHIQLSFQDSRHESAQLIAGTRNHDHKVALAETIRKLPVAFTVNLVVHRGNLDHIEEMLAFIERLRPGRIEIAHAQYYGWALNNRAALLPTPQQLKNCAQAVEAAQQRLSGKIRIDCVVPDYYARYPKACMGGWGRRLLLINPAGRVLPCHAAEVIPDLQFDSVRELSLEWIWNQSATFQRFRGEDWMREPCKSCERKEQDFGGCRCQALLFTGDATATDPVCSLSPDHNLVQLALASSQTSALPQPWIYRTNVG